MKNTPQKINVLGGYVGLDGNVYPDTNTLKNTSQKIVTMDDINTLERYDCELTGSGYMYGATMERCDGLGDWVRYEDVKALFLK